MDWQVGTKCQIKDGTCECVEINPTIAKFRMPDGTIKEFPNIFQEKINPKKTTKTKVVQEKKAKAAKIAVVEDDEDELMARVNALKAKKAKLAALHTSLMDAAI